MATNPDVAIAESAFAEEASVLQALVSQAAAGDVNARGLLITELASARQLRSGYHAAVPIASTTTLDAAIDQAAGFLSGGGVLSAGGLKLGALTVPWMGVALIAGLVFLSSRVGKRQ